MLVDDVAALVNTVANLEGRVHMSLDYQRLTAKGLLPQSPQAAFVLSLGFDAKPSDRATGLHRQKIVERLGVILVVQAADDPEGTRARSVVEALTEAVIAAVIGQRPASAEGPLEMVRGRLIANSEGNAFYQIEFSTYRFVRTPE